MTARTATRPSAVQARVGAELAAHLPHHLGLLGWDPGRLASYQRGRLRALLARAVADSPFHARRLRGIDVDRFELAGLADFAASIIRPGLARRLSAGPLPPEGLVIGLVCAASPVHSSGFGAATAVGPPVRIAGAAATLPLPEIVRRLNEVQPPALLGYPSKLAELAREQRSGRLRLAPRSVSATSELLTPEDRRDIEEGFGLPVINSFASTEGLVGHSEPGGEVLRFASDMCLVELVDEDYQPVPDGVTSAKVLVTNLQNLTQPLVRYELTNRFTAPPQGEGPPAGGHLLASVEGRSGEIFRYRGVDVHPHVIRSALVAERAVREYQVRETGRGIEVACAVDAAIDRPAVAARLARALSLAGLAQPQVSVSVVGAIARDARTGKVRRFIPHQPAACGATAAGGR
jgi:phenylacetate-coenzyme A ligase PaaK-like adenylate-forming protein